MEAGLRIAIVGPGFPPQVGGVEYHLARLSEELCQLGHTVDVLTQQSHFDVQSPPVEHLPSGATVRWFKSRTRSKQFAVAPGLLAYLRQHRASFDVVHAHSFHAIPALGSAIVTKSPFVFSPHYHGVGHTTSARLLHVVYDPIARKAFARANTVICNSDNEAAAVGAAFPAYRSRIRVVYPGIDAAEITASEPYPMAGTTILVAGRIEEYKQIDLTIRALRSLPERVSLVVLGVGSAQAALEQLASTEGVAERVRFLGSVTTADVRRWQRTADVAVTLSRHEAFGLVLLESLVAGAAVLASDIPAHREVAALANGQVLFVSVEADPTQVASSIQKLLAARAPATSSTTASVPSWHGLASQCAEIYEAALAAAR